MRKPIQLPTAPRQKFKPVMFKNLIRNEDFQQFINTDVDMPIKVERCVGQFERSSEQINEE